MRDRSKILTYHSSSYPVCRDAERLRCGAAE